MVETLKTIPSRIGSQLSCLEGRASSFMLPPEIRPVEQGLALQILARFLLYLT